MIFEKSTEVNCAPEVVWVSLWFGSLASRYVALLNQIGVKTELISSNVHFDASEIHASVSKVLNLRTNRIRKLYTLYKLLKYLKSSPTQKIFVDMSMSIGILVTFIFMARLKNAALFIHDPIPHDKAHEYGWLNSKLKESLIKKCMILVTFSLESKEILTILYPDKPVHVINLIPEIEPAIPVSDANSRKNFAMIGRWSSYKGFDKGLIIWEAFLNRYPESKDNLDLWISGLDKPLPLKNQVNLRSGSHYTWKELMSELPHYKGIIMPYISGSQSGVQLLAWYSGVPCLISNIRSLTQNQPLDMFTFSSENIQGWVNALHELSNANSAVRIGLSGRAVLEVLEIETHIQNSFRILIEALNVKQNN